MSADLSGARVAVTGATGCIGSALVRQLVDRGASVTALGRAGSGAAPGCRSLTIDLADPASVAAAFSAAAPDLAVHVATPAGHPASPAARSELVGLGVLGMTAVLEAAAAQGVGRLVQVGSSLEVAPSDRPLREDDPLRPITLRGAVKAAQTVLCLQQSLSGAVPVVIVRPFAVYGPHEAATRFVPTALRAALEGGVLPLPSIPSRRDFVHADDVARGIVAALTTPGVASEVFNLGTGVATTLTEVVSLVERVTGARVRTEIGGYPSRPVDGSFGIADVTHAGTRLGWRAAITLEEGLASTAAWVGDGR